MFSSLLIQFHAGQDYSFTIMSRPPLSSSLQSNEYQFSSRVKLLELYEYLQFPIICMHGAKLSAMRNCLFITCWLLLNSCCSEKTLCNFYVLGVYALLYPTYPHSSSYLPHLLNTMAQMEDG